MGYCWNGCPWFLVSASAVQKGMFLYWVIFAPAFEKQLGFCLSKDKKLWDINRCGWDGASSRCPGWTICNETHSHDPSCKLAGAPGCKLAVSGQYEHSAGRCGGQRTLPPGPQQLFLLGRNARAYSHTHRLQTALPCPPNIPHQQASTLNVAPSCLLECWEVYTDIIAAHPDRVWSRPCRPAVKCPQQIKEDGKELGDCGFFSISLVVIGDDKEKLSAIIIISSCTPSFFQTVLLNLFYYIWVLPTLGWSRTFSWFVLAHIFSTIDLNMCVASGAWLGLQLD